jgi:hypothetical protein
LQEIFYAATIAFGMGIDKANVRYIYHYHQRNQPKSLRATARRSGAPGTWDRLICFSKCTSGSTPELLVAHRDDGIET